MAGSLLAAASASASRSCATFASGIRVPPKIHDGTFNVMLFQDHLRLEQFKLQADRTELVPEQEIVICVG